MHVNKRREHMGSNAFGSKRPPSGRQFRDGALGRALKELYKEVDEGFEAVEQSSAGVPVFESKASLLASAAYRVEGAVVSVQGPTVDLSFLSDLGVPVELESPDVPFMYTWCPNLAINDVIEPLRGQDIAGLILFPDDIWGTEETPGTRVGAWAWPVAIVGVSIAMALMGGEEESDSEVTIDYPMPLRLSPPVEGAEEGDRFLSAPEHEHPFKVFTKSGGVWTYADPQVGKLYFFNNANHGDMGATPQTLFVLNAQFTDGVAYGWCLSSCMNEAPYTIQFGGKATSPAGVDETYGRVYIVSGAPDSQSEWANMDHKLAWLEPADNSWTFSDPSWFRFDTGVIVSVYDHVGESISFWLYNKDGVFSFHG